jgi:hypothetical protein
MEGDQLSRASRSRGVRRVRRTEPAMIFSRADQPMTSGAGWRLFLLRPDDLMCFTSGVHALMAVQNLFLSSPRKKGCSERHRENGAAQLFSAETIPLPKSAAQCLEVRFRNRIIAML